MFVLPPKIRHAHFATVTQRTQVLQPKNQTYRSTLKRSLPRKPSNRIKRELTPMGEENAAQIQIVREGVGLLRSASRICAKPQLLGAFSHLVAPVSFRQLPVCTVHMGRSGLEGRPLGDRNMGRKVRSLERGMDLLRSVSGFALKRNY